MLCIVTLLKIYFKNLHFREEVHSFFPTQMRQPQNRGCNSEMSEVNVKFIWE